MTESPKPRRVWVQVRRDDKWQDLIAAPEADAKEHVERIAKELGESNVRIKPSECGS